MIEIGQQAKQWRIVQLQRPTLKSEKELVYLCVPGLGGCIKIRGQGIGNKNQIMCAV